MTDIIWNREAAAHLLRRAGLPGPPDEVEAINQLKTEAAVDGLLLFEGIDNSEMEAHLQGLDLDLTTYPGILAEWVVRFVHTRRPFEERMALFWHMHFATGIKKVISAPLLRAQIQMFREQGRSRLDDLLLAVSRDPAMLVWLDNIHNHAAAPNENYARELLELYSMGINTYTQEDVVEAARAFTGWTIYRRFGTFAFIFNPRDHDYGTKTFLGEDGGWNGEDIIRIICGQEVTPRFIAAKMWAHFGAGEAPAGLMDRMAETYWISDHSLLEMFRTLFTDPDFYTAEQRRVRVKGPVEFTCGLLRQIKGKTTGEVLGALIAGQGLGLFDAPDPSGWKEGLSWITTATLLLRSQLASAVGLVREGVLRVDLPGLLRDAGADTAEKAVTTLSNHLDLPELSRHRREALAAYVITNPFTGGVIPFDLNSGATLFKLAGLIQLLAADPNYQVS